MSRKITEDTEKKIVAYYCKHSIEQTSLEWGIGISKVREILEKYESKVRNKRNGISVAEEFERIVKRE